MIKPLRKRVIGLLIILIAIAVNTGVIATTGFYAEGFLNSVSHNEEKPVVKGDSEFKIGGINDAAQTLSINLWNAYETYYMQLPRSFRPSTSTTLETSGMDADARKYCMSLSSPFSSSGWIALPVSTLVQTA